MGEVWKARDTRLDRVVAIKTSKAQFSERFAREARAIAVFARLSVIVVQWRIPTQIVSLVLHCANCGCLNDAGDAAAVNSTLSERARL
jgi:hypothetical protein